MKRIGPIELESSNLNLFLLFTIMTKESYEKAKYEK